MTVRRLAVWFGGILLLALVSRARMDETSSGRCRLDGNRLVPVYEVDLMRDGRILERFCCVRCAQEWPGVHDGEYWQVRDEVSGRAQGANEFQVRGAREQLLCEAPHLAFGADKSDSDRAHVGSPARSIASAHSSRHSER